MIVAIDFGITNTDIVVSNDNALDFFSFKTNLPIEEGNILELLNRIKINHKSIKTAFTLRESEGKSYEEISIITNTPIGTVRSRIFRARESIIEYMKKELINHE